MEKGHVIQQSDLETSQLHVRLLSITAGYLTPTNKPSSLIGHTVLRTILAHQPIDVRKDVN